MAQKESAMKKCLSSVLVSCAALLFLSTIDVKAASSWQKYTAPDKAFSFHYPRGWKVVARESTFDITNAIAAPGVALPASAAIERNGRAFLFVLEFALGAPLTGSQEETVLAELRRGWESSAAEDLKKYDAYPKVVEAIIHASDKKAVEDLRVQLENSTREWLQSSDQSDPVVSLVAGVLREKGKALIPGDPPLTVMAAAAYGEMYAFSELLARIPNATPDQISQSAVSEIRSRLLKAWSGFTAEERGQVASAPGLWVALRSVLRYGSPADQSQVRARLVKIAAPAESSEEPASEAPSGDTQGAGKSNIVGNLIKHQVMMNIQQMTFSHYMYCHGFRSSIY